MNLLVSFDEVMNKKVLRLKINDFQQSDFNVRIVLCHFNEICFKSGCNDSSL